MAETLKITTFRDLDWDLKRPCQDCPFRRSTPPHEGTAAAAFDTILSLEDHRFAHSCHKTDPRSDSPGGRRLTGRPKHCRGALIMIVKSGKGYDLQLPLLRAGEAGLIDLDELTRAAKADRECYTVTQFVVAQARFAEAFLERDGGIDG
jgi:hypothetical protein